MAEFPEKTPVSPDDIGAMVRGFGRELPGNLQSRVLSGIESQQQRSGSNVVKKASALSNENSGSSQTGASQSKSQSKSQEQTPKPPQPPKGKGR